VGLRHRPGGGLKPLSKDSESRSAKQAGFDERGLVKEMRRQPRIACAVSWVPLSIPIFASQRPVSVISSSNTTRVSSGICWSAADMRLAAE
jgi:hypothetical protein